MPSKKLMAADGSVVIAGKALGYVPATWVIGAAFPSQSRRNDMRQSRWLSVDGTIRVKFSGLPSSAQSFFKRFATHGMAYGSRDDYLVLVDYLVTVYPDLVFATYDKSVMRITSCNREVLDDMAPKLTALSAVTGIVFSRDYLWNHSKGKYEINGTPQVAKVLKFTDRFKVAASDAYYIPVYATGAEPGRRSHAREQTFGASTARLLAPVFADYMEKSMERRQELLNLLSHEDSSLTIEFRKDY